ncbi:coiled-coil domain-containing protein 78 isoform X2 [Pogoniulus pusillus]|uniref:coiled-coil domain-containing protein 78 isoform X2 n=1 Tax=Pogoniulus pusillus TaxID=488313 RepID=UPI0030B930B1
MDLGSGAENEKGKLQDRNEELQQVRDLQERTGKLAGSKSNLSARVILGEEEKLKMSKDLLDLQIETNKMKEQYETENFELKNKMLALEQRVEELELSSQQVSSERDALRERLQALEGRRQELADEYITLKSNYLALGKQLDQEVMKNEELSTELLNMAKTRSSLPHTQSNLPTAMAADPSGELGRAGARLQRGSARRVKLPGDQEHIKVELEKLKQTYNCQQQKLEERVLVMEKELQEAKAATGDSQQKLVEQSAAYMDSKASKAAGPSRAPADGAAMKSFVDNMLQGIRASYRAREEQLARAARGYQKRMKTLVKKHENLLIAYGLQREQIRASGSCTMDCGPAELHFSITDPELLTNTAWELQRLREQKAKLELQLQEVQQSSPKEPSALPLAPQQLLAEEVWAELRKQLLEFTHNTQEGLEQERSQLLARALVAEEQVSELQAYIDQHLARYKQEILQLQQAAGSAGPLGLGAGVASRQDIQPRASSQELSTTALRSSTLGNSRT